MTGDTRNHLAPPVWLVDWMREAGHHAQCHSLTIGSSGRGNLRAVAAAVADYLNEFDGDGACQWRSFDHPLLLQLACNPSSRNLVLAGSPPQLLPGPPRPDLDRIIRRLARLGGVILVGPASHDATTDLHGTFHICLASDASPDPRRFHLCLNPARLTMRSLVCIIADSFLNWSNQRDLPAPPSSRLRTRLRKPGPGSDAGASF